MTRYADRPLSLTVRSYRSLLPVLPRDFRHHYGSDMVETFREMINEARLRGAFAVAALWLTAVLRLLSVSVREHWDAFKNNWSPVGNESDPHDKGGREPMNRIFNELRQAARSFR